MLKLGDHEIRLWQDVYVTTLAAVIASAIPPTEKHKTCTGVARAAADEAVKDFRARCSESEDIKPCKLCGEPPFLRTSCTVMCREHDNNRVDAAKDLIAVMDGSKDLIYAWNERQKDTLGQ